MSNITFLLLVLVAVFATVGYAQDARRCNRPNEHFECGLCQRTCRNYNQPCPRRDRCIDGCYCDRGYARDSRGVCIPISRCPSRSNWEE